MKKLQFRDLGLIDFKEAWDIQERLLEEMIKIKTEGDCLLQSHHFLFCEHPHVYTIGKSGSPGNLLIDEKFMERIGATFYRINRGGDITYHGTGQIVGYPILDLEKLKLSPRQYIEKLEEVIILVLKKYNIAASRLPGATGVWIDAGLPQKERKICAVGVRISRGITMHGFAFNINTNLDYFTYIRPCGFADKGVTSLRKELEHEISLQEVKEEIKQVFSSVFAVEVENYIG